MIERILQRRQDYYNAVARLKEGLEQKESDIIVDGILHRYEFTFELAWKTIKDCLEYQGIVENIGSPREILKLAYKHKIIENGEEWIQMMLDRNQLSHLYDEEISRKIYKNIKEKHIKNFEKFEEKLKYII